MPRPGATPNPNYAMISRDFSAARPRPAANLTPSAGRGRGPVAEQPKKAPQPIRAAQYG